MEIQRQTLLNIFLKEKGLVYINSIMICTILEHFNAVVTQKNKVMIFTAVCRNCLQYRTNNNP